MEFEQIIRLVEAVSDSGLTEFDYEEGNVKLHMGKKQPKQVISCGPVESIPTIMAEQPVVEVKQDEIPANVTEVVSPIVGVFYESSSPDAEPFVKVGQRIEAGQVIGIIEAMKLMNEIESDVSGVITEILVRNGDGVEYGQPLIRVEK
ncbi:MAG: acetyl-CoA carboxylase biotin carboxyl carrier protein [Clostridia bacterium]|nr:acetyl-CoA carboxylase biotin carboxyl carrier protein [Lachnospiraceae bacterium]NCC01445.1 acetyl-CoA carboxylase biotin carboxyl carrier protein [Clostridia bacterium]NCD02109.1 acetyl-CoA carboxylase biotin carboxyl carrier protein [Clostridia bacterium]